VITTIDALFTRKATTVQRTGYAVSVHGPTTMRTAYAHSLCAVASCHNEMQNYNRKLLSVSYI